MTRVLPLTLAVTLLGLAACSSPVLEPLADTRIAHQTRPGGGDAGPDGDDPPLTPGPDVTPTVGIITAAPSSMGPATFLIEEHPDRPVGAAPTPLSTGDKYYVTVTETTAIWLRGPNGEARAARFEEIAVGMRAEVWLVGPVRESYPAQAAAGRIALFAPEA
jgi:hypothetical protein